MVKSPLPLHEESSLVEAGPPGVRRAIACRAFAGAAPTLVWLGGYRSDMLGTKAERLAALSRSEGLGFLRFDYSGHGASGGRFEEGTISVWREDAKAAIEAKTEGPLILAGSSMGAWIALLLLRDPDIASRIRGLLLLAPAPDFTERLLRPALSDDQKRDLAQQGYCTEPSAYAAEPNVYTRALIEDGTRNLVMHGTIEAGCPIHIIQGMADPDVPFSHALELVTHLPADGVTVTLVPGGDHRLSRETDLQQMERAIGQLVAETRAS